MIYVVGGMARSGTSMMMRCLEKGGMDCVYIDKPNKWNHYGDYELPGITKDEEWFRKNDGKCLKLLRTTPLHIPHDIPVKVVFMRRNAVEIVLSLKDRLGTGATAPELEKKAGQYVEALKARPNIELIEVWYPTVLEEPVREMCRVRDFGFEIDPIRAASGVDHTQRHHVCLAPGAGFEPAS